MIKVLIIDDEPFVRQGLKVIIEWESYGYEVVDEAENGAEAIRILHSQDIDLAFVDLKMPGISGLEVITYAEEHISKKIRFVILTGHADFEFARQAIRLNVEEYMLKPARKENLIQILEMMQEELEKEKKKEEQEKLHERLEYDICISHIVWGKYTEEEYRFVMNRLPEGSEWQYISYELDTQEEKFKTLNNEGKIRLQRKCMVYLEGMLKEDYYHVVPQMEQDEDVFGVGLLFTPSLAKKRDMESTDYIFWLNKRLCQHFSCEIMVHTGSRAVSVRQISESYHSIRVARCLHNFAREKTTMRIADRWKNYGSSKGMAGIDELIECVKLNQRDQIEQAMEHIYENIRESAMSLEILNANIYYLLYHLIDLAKELDEESNQEDVLRYISQESFEKIALSGSENELTRFVLDYAAYLEQLRNVETKGVLEKIEQYIAENYREKLSLKILGEIFHFNNVYLGQLFKKKHGISFKEYLTEIRIKEATRLLEETELRVYAIAEEVGFYNADHFINRFVQTKGITPFQYRKKNRKGGKINEEAF